MGADAVKAALVNLASEGVIHPAAVVEAARDPRSPLHPHFEWDDGVAADAWRLEQARRLIRVHVEVIGGPDVAPVRAFVSLSPDRKEGGGYRPIRDVLVDVTLRSQLLDDAMRELQTFRRKYEQLLALAPVIRAIDQVTGEIQAPEGPKRRAA